MARWTAASEVPRSASTRARNFARWFLRRAIAIRSVEKNVAAVVVSASSSAADERLGSPGSNPWTTSNDPSARVAARLARRAHRQRDPLAERPWNSGADRDNVPDRAALQGASPLEEVGGT